MSNQRDSVPGVFSAGRFEAKCYGPTDGSLTWVRKIGPHGVKEEVVELRAEDLLDLEYILKRAIVAHGLRRQ